MHLLTGRGPSSLMDTGRASTPAMSPRYHARGGEGHLSIIAPAVEPPARSAGCGR